MRRDSQAKIKCAFRYRLTVHSWSSVVT